MSIYLDDLLGDNEVRALLSDDQQLQNMLRVEAAYTAALGATGRLPQDQADRVTAAILATKPDAATLRQGAAVDGVVVPALVGALKAVLPKDDHVALHTGMTSQDVVDTALTLSLGPVLDVFADRLGAVQTMLDQLSDRFGATPLMGRTRHQAALPITVGHRIAAWAQPLAGLKAALEGQRIDLLRLQLGGPVGLSEGLDGPVAAHMAKSLGLTAPDAPWHTDRHALIGFGGWLSQVSGALGKIGRDIALMAQQGVDEITLSGAGSSSAMPHKQNPILAETLVTLAQFNATQIGGLHHCLVHEQERSGTAWALEWMILPKMVEATGAGLGRATTLLDSITAMGALTE